MSFCTQQLLAKLKEVGHSVPQSVLNQWEEHLVARQNALSPAEFQAEMAKLVENDLAVELKLEKAAKVMDAKLYASVVSNYTLSGKLSGLEYLKAVIDGGAIKGGIGTNLSVHGYEAEVLTSLMSMYSTLDKYAKEFETGKLNREIIQELDALQRGRPTGESKSKVAVEVAGVFHAINNEIAKRTKAVSPTFRKLTDYYVEQIHNMERVANTPKEQWVADVMNWYGKESYPGLTPEKKKAKFERAYEQITSGASGLAFKEVGNRRFRLAASREFVPNDWKSFAEYQAKYGDPSIHTTMVRSMLRASREIAVTTKFGSNSDKFLEQSIKGIAKVATPEEVAKMAKGRKDLEARMEFNMGMRHTPAEGMLSWLQNTRILTGYALSGKMVLSSMPDMVHAINLIRDTTGMSYAGVAHNLMGNFMKGLNEAEAKATLLRTGVYLESFKRHLHRDLGFGVDPGNTGKFGQAMTWIGDKYGRVNLADRYMAASRAAIAATVSDYIGELSGKKFLSLPKGVQESLNRYGFTDKNWWMVGQVSHTIDLFDNGRKVVTPESFKFLSDDLVKEHLVLSDQWKETKKNPMPPKSMMDKVRQDLAMNMAALLNDHADIGTSTPRARQQYLMWGNTDAGTYWGQFRRLVMQFKGSSLVGLDNVRRRWSNGETAQGKVAAVGSIAAQLYFIGMLTEWAHQAWQGKTPEDPTSSLDFHVKAFLRGGVAGPYAETIISSAQAQGPYAIEKRILEGLAGPTTTTLARGMAESFSAGKELLGDSPVSKSTKKEALETVLRLTPFQNVFWMQGAINWAFLNAFREELNNGIPAANKKMFETPSLFTESGNQEYFIPQFDPSGGR